MRIVVIDYNGGNLASAAEAARKAAARFDLHAEVSISRDTTDILNADRLILPGQGAMADCARGLGTELRSLLETATENGTPFLGICVGMQLMCDYGVEYGRTEGLGWISGSIQKITEAQKEGLRLPHMGWNTLDFIPGQHLLTKGLTPGDHGYFVHSYALHDGSENDLVASSNYGARIPAIVARGNRCGTQFHVEKSQDVGLTIMGNFLKWEM
ncbi:imidazole glycerol phosphate synthase subunit HisH [Neokomagataea thailandica NBRC 106555]|uniref:Imidazole glycerol phosphate synthase subunit HisH n=2 Tax=Neokomagataea TaxID=1223423 RepID=A0A4Y6VAJ0_9PROT|nr:MULTISPECIES: imidazole glycerol phosphate synthase subunit HisH [Neokomagataea]QDH25536.1 imidazole glycerol phosphate synthase subunit HisH [Neokomagataea tanensis]GBR55633.1 imidazole glycerol phosphate synthase subunit HisH [Neokomagataea thailandica NBRC 106555]